MFALSLHLAPSPNPGGWGVLKGWETWVPGDESFLESNVAVPAAEVALSVFFLLRAFPSALAEYKNDVGRTRTLAPEPWWQKKTMLPLSSTSPLPPSTPHPTLPTQTSLTPTFPSCTVFTPCQVQVSYDSLSGGVIRLMFDTKEWVTYELNLPRSDWLHQKITLLLLHSVQS